MSEQQTAEIVLGRYRAVLTTDGERLDGRFSALCRFEVFVDGGGAADVTGDVRYDGCLNVDLDVHLCGLEDLDELHALLRAVYESAGELMGGFA